LSSPNGSRGLPAARHMLPLNIIHGADRKSGSCGQPRLSLTGQTPARYQGNTPTMWSMRMFA
jgi:hypothetical protein